MADLTGKTLGNYRIVERIGRGGMATVYKAYQPALERYVAVKVIHEPLAADDEMFLKRFQREAKAVAALRHPDIVQVFDFGTQDDVSYMVMEYLEGTTLKAELNVLAEKGQTMPLEEVQRIFRAVASALEHAHRQGMVHRDIKPANVMLTTRGDVILTDFGIAKIVGGTQYTATGAVTGTPAYMSPEQGQGERGDERSDIYALGVVLYEMVTGRVPYDADTPLAVILKHISAPLPLPRQLNPAVPEAVEQVILKALAKAPDDRYQTVAQMTGALEAALAGEAVSVRERPPEVAVTPSAPPRRAVPWMPIGLGLLAAAVAIVAVGGIALLAPRRPTPTPALPPTVTVSVMLPTATETATPTAATPATPTSAPSPTAGPTPPLAAVTVKWTYTAPDAVWSLDAWGDGLAAGDLNDDSIPDVVFGTEAGYVVSVNGADGAELWSYRITAQTDALVNADVVDVDDDGVLDVVGTGKGDSTSQGRAIICALDRNGTQKWQAQGDYEEAVDLAYGDIDGDGDTDVVASVGTYSWGGGQVILIDGATGTRVWSQSLGSGHAMGIDAQDVDDDGDMEVAVENYDNKVFLLDGATGSILWSRPKGWYGRDVIIEDVDDDGTFEVVSGAGGVTSYDSEGDQEWVGPEREGGNISSGDVNGDGQTEVVFSDGFAGETYVLDGRTGEALWSRTRSGAHAVGDIDGDGVDDIVVGTVRLWGIEPPYSVDAVDGSNNPLWSYPLDFLNQDRFGLVTVNLDSDPALEVLVATGTQLLALRR